MRGAERAGRLPRRGSQGSSLNTHSRCGRHPHPPGRRRLARSLRARLAALPGDWQVFLDTDGDLTFSPGAWLLGCAFVDCLLGLGGGGRLRCAGRQCRTAMRIPSCPTLFNNPSPLRPPPLLATRDAATEVALRAADLAYVPYAPTESDHDRATEAVAVSAGRAWSQPTAGGVARLDEAARPLRQQRCRPRSAVLYWSRAPTCPPPCPCTSRGPSARSACSACSRPRRASAA